MFFIDLDNFKNINDSLGHDKGDQVLIEVAERLSATIRSEDTLCRLGGDEFILLSESVDDVNAVYNLASRDPRCAQAAGVFTSAPAPSTSMPALVFPSFPTMAAPPRN